MIGGAFSVDIAALLDDAPALVLPGAPIASGRTALALVAERHPGRWLLPAYLCASVLEPLRGANVELDFYSVGADLRPRPVDAGDAAVVLVVDYFGFPPSDLNWLTGDAVVLEDCVMGSLVELPDAAAGRFGAVAFTSFRKYLPVPDGGLLVGIDVPPLPPASGDAVRCRLLGQALRGAWLAGLAPDAEPVFLELIAAGEEALSTEPPAAMSRVTERLLARLDLREAAERRRANFSLLLELLPNDVVPLYDTLPAGVSPLVLPVRVAGRDALRSRLAERGIFCPVHWPLPPEIDSERFSDEQALSREILGLPVDQRYGASEMRELAAAL